MILVAPECVHKESTAEEPHCVQNVEGEGGHVFVSVVSQISEVSLWLASAAQLQYWTKIETVPQIETLPLLGPPRLQSLRLSPPRIESLGERGVWLETQISLVEAEERRR